MSQCHLSLLKSMAARILAHPNALSSRGIVWVRQTVKLLNILNIITTRMRYKVDLIRVVPTFPPATYQYQYLQVGNILTNKFTDTHICIIEVILL